MAADMLRVVAEEINYAGLVNRRLRAVGVGLPGQKSRELKVLMRPTVAVREAVIRGRRGAHS